MPGMDEAIKKMKNGGKATLRGPTHVAVKGFLLEMGLAATGTKLQGVRRAVQAAAGAADLSAALVSSGRSQFTSHVHHTATPLSLRFSALPRCRVGADSQVHSKTFQFKNLGQVKAQFFWDCPAPFELVPKVGVIEVPPTPLPALVPQSSHPHRPLEAAAVGAAVFAQLAAVGSQMWAAASASPPPPANGVESRFRSPLSVRCGPATARA